MLMNGLRTGDVSTLKRAQTRLVFVTAELDCTVYGTGSSASSLVASLMKTPSLYFVECCMTAHASSPYKLLLCCAIFENKLRGL
jgi:hypothetical protein